MAPGRFALDPARHRPEDLEVLFGDRFGAAEQLRRKFISASSLSLIAVIVASSTLAPTVVIPCPRIRHARFPPMAAANSSPSWSFDTVTLRG